MYVYMSVCVWGCCTYSVHRDQKRRLDHYSVLHCYLSCSMLWLFLPLESLVIFLYC